MSSLSVQGIVKCYQKRNAVNNVTLQMESGDVIGLLGPNGAGKTTSFYIIVGLILCDAGKILLDGSDITNFPLHARSRLGIGYLPQEPSVFRKLNVKDNVLAILQTRRDLSKTERLARLDALLQELHIDHISSTLGMSLSGGERRRVEIARALAVEPKFMLLDEPFAGVDPLSVLDIQKIINHLSKRGIGVLITDHNVRETLKICHRAYIMNRGEVISAGTPEEILNNKHVRDVYLGHQFEL